MVSNFLSKIILRSYVKINIYFLLFKKPSYLNYNNFSVIIPVERFRQAPFRFAAFKKSIYLRLLDHLKLLAIGWSIC